MKSVLRTTLLVAALAGLCTFTLSPVARLLAQTALTQTTLSAALAAPAQGSPATVVTLTSGTGVSVGVGIAIDNEYMVVQSATPQTTRWNVTRGQSGTQADAHASGSAALISAANNFYFNSRQPVGTCTSTLVQAMPRVVISPQISIYNCPAVSTLTGSAASSWDRITAEGYGYPNASRYTGWTYATAGAITIQNGLQNIGSSGALAMTLAAPAVYQTGMQMLLFASTAQAHTVTYTAGFYGNTTSSDVATYGGAIGDFMVIGAYNGAWRVLAIKNVTIG